MQFLIAGAGAIGGYIGARMARAGQDVTLLRARPASTRHAGARAAGPQRRRRFRGPPARHWRSRRGRASGRHLPGRQGPRTDQLAPQIQPLIGENTTVVSTQNGIPWWYFQAHAGELHRPPSRTRRSRRRDRRRRFPAKTWRPPSLISQPNCGARRDPPHRGQSHVTRRARWHALGSLQGHRRGADQSRHPLPGDAKDPYRDLGQDPGQRRVQSDQRADARDAGPDGARSRGPPVVRSIMAEVEAVRENWESSCPSRSISALPARRRSASTKLRCCRIWSPAAPWNWKPVVGAVVELGERLGIAMPHTRTVYACTRLLSSHALSVGGFK